MGRRDLGVENSAGTRRPSAPSRSRCSTVSFLDEDLAHRGGAPPGVREMKKSLKDHNERGTQTEAFARRTRRASPQSAPPPVCAFWRSGPRGRADDSAG